jgi:putative thioredoxin
MSSNVTASFGGSFGGGYKQAEVAPSLISDTTTATFVQDVVEESRIQPVLVDFWAPWCGPCKALTPIIEKCVNGYKGKVKLVKMNIDDHPEVAGQLGIQSIPAVVAFVNGQGIDGFMGAIPEAQINAFIEKLTKGIKNQTDEILDAAALTLETGDFEGAAELYGVVLQEEPENVTALTGLAKCFVEKGELEAAKNLLTPIKKKDANVNAVLAAIELAEAALTLSPLAELEAAVAKDASHHQARFDLAVALNAVNRRMEASDHLLEIYKQDKLWNDDGARRQLVLFFESWGFMDDAAKAGRRKLSSLMFR